MYFAINECKLFDGQHMHYVQVKYIYAFQFGI